MELPDLAQPPPPAEQLAQTQVSRVLPVTAGELTLSLDSRFTPNRVGATEGTTTVALYGQLQPERQHPGTDYQGTELGTHNVLTRVRLGRYRWLLSDVSMEPPCVTVTVDRVAAENKRLAPPLATNDQCTFWLSTLGVDELALEARSHPLLSTFQDYVQVAVWSYSQDRSGPTPGRARAPRERRTSQ